MHLSGQIHSTAVLPHKRLPNVLNRRLSDPQGQSGRFGEDIRDFWMRKLSFAALRDLSPGPISPYPSQSNDALLHLSLCHKTLRKTSL